jgi:transposase
VADCKLISKENVATMCDNGGYFLAPAPMYESYAKVFEAALADHDRELLLPYKGRFNRGFEVPMHIRHEDRDYPLRMIILYDHGVAHIKRKALGDRIAKTRKAFAELDGRINKRRLKSPENIGKACAAILKKHHTDDFFSYNITNSPVVRYKNPPGRPARNKPVEKVAQYTDHFQIQLDLDEKALGAALDRCGYYPLLTNRSREQLTIAQAMLEHKDQYKNEHVFRRSKGPYNLEPIYLHLPERIEAYLMLFKIALQIVVLIERTARNNIQARDRGLDDFMPNRKDVRNPRSEQLLTAFQYIVKGVVPMPDGTKHGFVSKLDDLQLQILAILEVPVHCYSYPYLIDSS